LTELSNNRKDLLEDIAKVQQHSLMMQQAVYTPQSQMEQTLAASRSVQGLLGHSRLAYPKSQKSAEYLERVSKLQSIISLADPQVHGLRLQAGICLGFRWNVTSLMPVALGSAIKSLSVNLYNLVKQCEANRGDFIPLILPNPGIWTSLTLNNSAPVHLPYLLLQYGLKLLCNHCEGPLLLMRAPIRDSLIWSDLHKNGNECCNAIVQQTPALFSLFEEEGIWICPNYFQSKDNRPSCLQFAHAVLTSNETIVRFVKKEKAIALWPFCQNLFSK
jgi:hypothetical protein